MLLVGILIPLSVTNPQVLQIGPPPIMIVGVGATALLMFIPAVISIIGFLPFPALDRLFVPKDNESWLRLRLVFQVACWYLLPICYTGFAILFLLFLRPTQLLQPVLLTLWLEFIYFEAMTWFDIMPDVFAHASDSSEEALCRDIHAYSQLGVRMLQRNPSSSAPYILASTLKAEEYFKERKLSWQALHVLNQRLNVISKLPPDSSSYSTLAFVANSLNGFPDMSRLVNSIGVLVTNEMKWVDDFTVKQRSMPSIIGVVSKYLGWIWAFMVIPFLGIPVLRDWVLAQWEMMPKTIPYDYVGGIFAVVIMLALFRTAATRFSPNLVSVRSYIGALRETSSNATSRL